MIDIMEGLHIYVPKSSVTVNENEKSYTDEVLYPICIGGDQLSVSRYSDVKRATRPFLRGMGVARETTPGTPSRCSNSTWRPLVGFALSFFSYVSSHIRILPNGKPSQGTSGTIRNLISTTPPLLNLNSKRSK